MANRVHKNTIGDVKLTNKQKEAIAIGVETEFFKVMKNHFAKHREIQTGLMLLKSGVTNEDVIHYRGVANGITWFIQELEKVAKEYNKTNGDADTDGIEPVD